MVKIFTKPFNSLSNAKSTGEKGIETSRMA